MLNPFFFFCYYLSQNIIYVVWAFQAAYEAEEEREKNFVLNLIEAVCFQQLPNHTWSCLKKKKRKTKKAVCSSSQIFQKDNNKTKLRFKSFKSDKYKNVQIKKKK